VAYHDQQRKQLLTIAREAVLSAAQGRALPPVEVEDQELQQPRGAFVTLKHDGALRGCIGFVQPLYPLHETVARAAAAAATQDPRFLPVQLAEVPGLSLEISVLTPPQPVEHPDHIEVGRHGLVVRMGSRSGLLLPQVPSEYGWDRDEFLAHTCLKAGLPTDAWRSGAEILCFEAEVFGEE